MTNQISFENFRVAIAEQFLESVSEPTPNTKLYLTYGRTTEWADDENPPTANASVNSEFEVWQFMIGGKKLTGSDLAHVIPRRNWVVNTVYQAYDHRNTDLHNTNNKFYVMNSGYSVYKCIANAITHNVETGMVGTVGSNSTVEPTTLNPDSTVQTSDGYIWKYMYTLDSGDILRFMTDEYMPVKTLAADDGSQQWDVQQGATDGAIWSIVMSNTGNAYTNTANITVTITGDGSDATATANINLTTNTVSSVTVTNPGSGYKKATVTIVGGKGTDGYTATADAIISPLGGHGSNPLYELAGKAVMINGRLNATEGDVLPAENDYRQIAIIKDPYLKDTSTVAENAAFIQAQTITTTGAGDYDADEYVYQGASLATATFTGVVLTWNVSTGAVRVINTTGEPSSGELIGANTLTSRFVASTAEGDFEPYSGQTLYMDNMEPITRAVDQTEDFKIAIKF